MEGQLQESHSHCRCRETEGWGPAGQSERGGQGQWGKHRQERSHLGKSDIRGGSLGVPWENSALMSCTLNVWCVSLVGHIIIGYMCDVCGIYVLH